MKHTSAVSQEVEVLVHGHNTGGLVTSYNGLRCLVPWQFVSENNLQVQRVRYGSTPAALLAGMPSFGKSECHTNITAISTSCHLLRRTALRQSQKPTFNFIFGAFTTWHTPPTPGNPSHSCCKPHLSSHTFTSHPTHDNLRRN